MKFFILWLSTVTAIPLSAATIFNVNFDPSGAPLISGPGGSLPPPPGLPSVSTLSANAGNTIHGNLSFVWIDQYDSGDYFTFRVTSPDPELRIALTGYWFGVESTPNGPTSFNIEVWSNGTLLSGAVTGLQPGTYDEPTYLLSGSSDAEIRIVGLGGTGDPATGAHQSFGMSTSSFAFAVVPEPSTMLLALAGLLAIVRMRCRSSAR